LAALGAWKDVHGVDVWSLKRVKHAVNLSLDVDIAIIVLIALDIKRQTEGELYTHGICLPVSYIIEPIQAPKSLRPNTPSRLRHGCILLLPLSASSCSSPSPSLSSTLVRNIPQFKQTMK
jgi:hypothetical protein